MVPIVEVYLFLACVVEHKHAIIKQSTNKVSDIRYGLTFRTMKNWSSDIPNNDDMSDDDSDYVPESVSDDEEVVAMDTSSSSSSAPWDVTFNCRSACTRIIKQHNQ